MRFHVGASVFSTFAVVQLATYALLQVPVGVLVDRFGSRVMVASGAAVMAVGQATLSMATEPAGALRGPAAGRSRGRDDLRLRAAADPGLVPAPPSCR